MAFVISCGCGRTYQLKDEFAGRLVTCPACGASLRATPPQRAAQADPVFEHDKFLLRQKHLSINEKYHVWDEEGGELLFVERPVHLLKSLAAIAAAIMVGGIMVVFIVLIALVIFPSRANAPQAGPGLQEIVAIGVMALLVGAAIVAAITTAVWIMPKRHVYFYRNETRAECLLHILQDKKFWLIMASYTVVDATGTLLATLHKNYLYNFFRKRWVCRRPDGSTLCVAQEDSLVLSLLRRFLGSFYGLLRTNFIIQAGESEDVIGEFNRKFTLLDRYVLDLSDDPQRTLDRRIALALGVMLDTGERR
ncbi:MAG TPA: hypothetical protein VHC22_04770 [Pirellulales bacterium]|nr:hypothetical protein [Pirellulales bacterium]